MEIVKCENLGFMPPAKRPPNILRDVSFALPKGGRLALIGGNGAGKSTLLKLLLGLQPIGEGSAHIMEKSVPDASSRQGIGYLADEPSPFPYLTGREYLRLFGQLEGLTGERLKEAVETALEVSGLKEAADRRTDRYSKGMRQRLEVERTLLVPRELVFLDEPLTGLDLESQIALKVRLKSLAEDGVSMVVTSHEPSILETLCTHVALLKSGRLVRFGTFEELFSQGGWEVRFKDESSVPEPLPEGAEPGSDKTSVVFEKYEPAESLLSSLGGSGKVVSFGTSIKGIEDLLEEVSTSE
jgi:ABC-2 type transport system ATP-binding protein